MSRHLRLSVATSARDQGWSEMGCRYGLGGRVGETGCEATREYEGDRENGGCGCGASLNTARARFQLGYFAGSAEMRMRAN